MAPKAMKGRGRGKATAKAKGKGKAKAKARAAVARAHEGDNGAVHENGVHENGVHENGAETALAVRPKAKAKASGLRKKIMESLGEKTVDEAMEDANTGRQTAEAMVAEAEAFEDAQAKQADSALKEYEAAKEGVTKAIEQERSMAEQYSEKGKALDEALLRIDESRKELMVAQQRVALVEVLQANQQRMQELEERRKAAQEAAEFAKQQFLAQKQLEKAALEATRKALDEARAQKGLGKGRGGQATRA